MNQWSNLAVSYFLLSMVLSAHSAFGGKLECEDLPMEDCAFAVSASGQRCVLETYLTKSGESIFECQTSIIMADQPEPYIESESCISACGVERMSVGFSSEGLLVRKFVEKLCSSDCQENCPNIIDLFTKLAQGEGVHLPRVCNFLKATPRRFMGAIKSSSRLLAERTDSLIEAWSHAEAPYSQSLTNSGVLAPSPL